MNADRIASLTGNCCQHCLKNLHGTHPRRGRAVYTRILRRRSKREWMKELDY